jgi:hypothetical protein
MLIALMYGFLHCFGKRPPTSDMGFCAFLGAAFEMCTIDMVILLSLAY